MSSIPDLFEVRSGTESTDAWGTAVAQSRKHMGITDINFTPIITSVPIKDRRASLQPVHVSVPVEKEATGMIEGIASYEDLPYYLNGLVVDSDPTTDTDVYLYEYVCPDGAAPIFAHYTLAYGDTDDIHSMLGATIQSLNISAANGEPCTFSANLIGKQISTDTFDSDAEADRTIIPIMGDHFALYIDPASDAAGTTPIANTAFTFSLDINTNRELVTHLGSLTPDKVREARWEGALRLTLELDSDSSPLLDSVLNTTSDVFERVVRLKASATATSDALPIYFQFDFNGVALEAPQMYSDLDGITTYELNLTGQKGSVLANWLKLSVQNTVSALP